MEPLLWDNLPSLALDLNGAGTYTKFSNQTLARIGSPRAAVKHNPMRHAKPACQCQHGLTRGLTQWLNQDSLRGSDELAASESKG